MRRLYFIADCRLPIADFSLSLVTSAATRLIEQLREGRVAKILQHEQAVLLVARQNFRRAETQFPEMRVNPDERRNDFRQTRGVHQDGGPVAVSETEVFARGGVAGERFAGGVAPAGGFKKFSRIVVIHGRTV